MSLARGRACARAFPPGWRREALERRAPRESLRPTSSFHTSDRGHDAEAGSCAEHRTKCANGGEESVRLGCDAPGARTRVKLRAQRPLRAPPPPIGTSRSARAPRIDRARESIAQAPRSIAANRA